MANALPEDLAAHSVFSPLLSSWLMESGALLPRGMHGVIQFEAGSALFHVVIHDDVRELRDGVAGEIDTWIETSDAELRALLEKRPAQNALRVTGNYALAEQFFGALAKAPRAKSPLQTRLAR